MGSGGKRAAIRVRDIASTWGLAIALLVIGFVVAYQFVEPAPPKRIVLATGVDGGAYQRFGEEYAAYLQAAGIEVELRMTEGSVENLALLRRGGFAARQTDDLIAISAQRSATTVPLIAGLEVANWSIGGFVRGPWLSRSIDASKEAIAVVAAHLGRRPDDRFGWLREHVPGFQRQGAIATRCSTFLFAFTGFVFCDM